MNGISGYLRIWQVLEVFPIGKSTWWAGVKEGRFPAPVKLGPRTTAWRADDIKALIENPPAPHIEFPHDNAGVGSGDAE